MQEAQVKIIQNFLLLWFGVGNKQMPLKTKYASENVLEHKSACDLADISPDA